MTALRAGFRYELLMQLRKRSIWITTFALAAFTAVISIPNYGKVFDEPDARTAMVFAGQSMMVLLPVGFGCLIADRLIRDDVLGVRQVLDATPGDPGWRLAGKYLGACFAGAVPIIAVYLLVAVGYVVRGGDSAAVHWALAMSGAVVVADAAVRRRVRDALPAGDARAAVPGAVRRLLVLDQPGLTRC